MSAPTEPQREQMLEAVAVLDAWEAEQIAFDAWRLTDAPHVRAEMYKAYMDAKAIAHWLSDAYRARWGK